VSSITMFTGVTCTLNTVC